MAQETDIEWTKRPGTKGRTWNPIRGCSKADTACDACYAMGIAARFSGAGQAYEGLAEMTERGPKWTGRVAFIEDQLKTPMKWRDPSTIFVNSMSDLFHRELSDVRIAQIWAVMCLCPRHVFIILTKRPDRMAQLLISPIFAILVRDALDTMKDGMKDLEIAAVQKLILGKNIWVGTSVGTKATVGRIDELRKIPAHVRLVSFEPLIEDLGHVNMALIQWAIAGKESGDGDARWVDDDAIRNIRDLAKKAGAAFFYKQDAKNGKKLKTPKLDGKKWVEFPG